MSPVRFRRSLGFALAGLRLAWREQRNFRIEVVIAVAVLLLAWWTSATVAPILMMTGLVLAFELTNSAVEALVDLVQPEHHALAAAAKDLSAGAVLVAALAALTVGVVVIGPPLLRKLQLGLGGG